jgi:hypothetical protein
MATLVKTTKEVVKKVESGFIVGLHKFPAVKKVKGEWKETGEIDEKFCIGTIQENGFFRGWKTDASNITPEMARAVVKEFNKYAN